MASLFGKKAETLVIGSIADEQDGAMPAVFRFEDRRPHQRRADALAAMLRGNGERPEQQRIDRRAFVIDAGLDVPEPHRTDDTAVAVTRDERKTLGRDAVAADLLRRFLAAIRAHDAVEQVFASNDIRGILGVEARLAKTDAMLLFCVTAAMGAMARAYLSWQRAEEETRPPWSWPAIFWTALAVGILIKGPLILMFAGLTIVTLAIVDRDASWLWKLRPVWGLMWMLVLVLPWFVAIFWRAGDAFFADSVGGDMLSKLGAQESHGAPPGLYLALFWITFWPGAPLAAMAAPAVWRARREPGAQFLLAWLIPSWIVFEAVLTKLPHYVLPLYPAIAILTVGAVERRVLSRSWLMRGSAWWFAIPAAASFIAVVGAVMLTRQPAFVAWPFIAASLIFGLLAWWLYDNNHAERSLLNALVAALMLAVTVYGIVLPSLLPLFPSIEVARALRNVTCVGPKAAAAGYHEPSLVFLTGTQTLLTDGSGAADFLRQGSCRFALIEQRSERSFVQRAEAIGLRYKVGTRIDGYNFSQGRAISISIFRSEGTE